MLLNAAFAAHKFYKHYNQEHPGYTRVPYYPNRHKIHRKVLSAVGAQAIGQIAKNLPMNNPFETPQRQIRGTPASSKRPRRGKSIFRTVNNNNTYITGSAPTHHSTSAGKFAKGHGVPKTLTAQYCKRGFAYDSTLGGRVQDSDCVYIGHTSWPADRTLYTVMLAFVRELLRHVDIDIETIDSTLPFLTGVDNIAIEWLDSTNTVQIQAIPYSPGTGDTVSTLAVTLFNFFRGAIVSNAKRYYQRIVLSTGDVVRVMMNLSTCQVDICNTSYLKVQNSTQSATSNAGSNDTEDINAVPLQGFSYFGRGNFTGLKEYALRSKSLAIVSAAMPELNSNSTTGVITLRTPNADSWAGSGIFYGNPPPAADMKNVTSTAYTTLEPGTMKTDKLEDCHKMNFNQFLYKNYIAGYVNSTDSPANAQFSRSSLGHFKVFGLEKKLFSNNQDQVQIRYELNQFIRAAVKMKKQTVSLQYNIPKILQDFLPPLPP